MPSVRVGHAIACAFVIVLSCPLAAQVRQTVGPARCVDCHDHRDEKEWWQTKDGDGKGKQHSKADRRLEDAKAPQYAKALGLTDVYDPNGACVTCHATVVAGSADFGVSCESCHGPGKDYLTPHQTKGTYATSIKLGMMDVKNKPEAWARTCMGCHVMSARPGMEALIKAGHTTGSDFDLARKFPVVALHFSAKYQPAQVAAAAAAFRPATRTADVASAKPAPPSAPTPAAATSPAPATAATTTPATAAPATSASGREGRVAPVAPAAPAAPVAPSARVAPAVARTEPVSLPPVTPVRVAASVARVAPVAPAAPAAPVAPDAPASPETPSARTASLQGRLIAWLEQLVAGPTQLSVAAPPARRQVYKGPDAELLRLQEEVIRLAIEALAAAPPKRQ
jgi:hypothetical protein